MVHSFDFQDLDMAQVDRGTATTTTATRDPGRAATATVNCANDTCECNKCVCASEFFIVSAWDHNVIIGMR